MYPMYRHVRLPLLRAKLKGLAYVIFSLLRALLI
jgi:hypothetical protein